LRIPRGPEGTENDRVGREQREREGEEAEEERRVLEERMIFGDSENDHDGDAL